MYVNPTYVGYKDNVRSLVTVLCEFISLYHGTKKNQRPRKSIKKRHTKKCIYHVCISYCVFKNNPRHNLGFSRMPKLEYPMTVQRMQPK